MPTSKRRHLRPDAFRVIAEYTYDWETWVDARGRTQWINPAVERITGYTVDECLARKTYPLNLVHPSDRKRLSQVLASASKGEAGNDIEFRIRRKDGTIGWVAVSWQAMRDTHGRSLGYRTSVRDIDDRKRMERQVNRLRRRAERAATARSALLANVSHELRSPAHCIAGFAALLAESDLGPREQRHVRVIADQASMMERQVEDLLQVAALDVATLRIDAVSFDVRALLDSLVDAADLDAKTSRGLRVERAIALSSPWVVGDHVRVSQVVRNLLDNALKFTPQGTIRLCAHREADGMLAIEVRDTGVGMSAEQLRHVTQAFFQADSRSVRRHGGVGLGLSIVERLVQAMGGRLELKSKLKQGTVARVLLPLLEASAPVTRRVAPPRELVTGIALVVDDSAVARELMVEWLHGLGWRAMTAGSGAEALRVVKQHAVDVVLLDYQMPELDGAATALELSHARPQAQRRPYVALITANVFAREQLGRARDAIDQVLVKPITRLQLAEVLRSASDGAEIDARVVQELLSAPSSKAPNLFAQLAPQTFAEQATALEDLSAAMERRDRSGIEQAAHRIAGLASVLGAHRVTTLARELMDKAPQRSFSFKQARSLAATIVDTWLRARGQLELTLRFQTEHNLETKGPG